MSSAVQNALENMENMSPAEKLELLRALQAQLGGAAAAARPPPSAPEAATAASSPIPAQHSRSHSKRSSGTHTPKQLDSPAAIKSRAVAAGAGDPVAHDVADPLSPLPSGGLTDSLQRHPSSLTSSFNAHAHSYASSPTGGNSLSNTLTNTAKSLTSTNSSFTSSSHTPGQHPGLLNSNSSMLEIRRTGSRFSSLGSEGRGGGAGVGTGSGNLQHRGRISSCRHRGDALDDTPEQTDEEEEEEEQEQEQELSAADISFDMSASLSRRDRTLTPRSAASIFPPPALSTPAESKEEQEARSAAYSNTPTTQRRPSHASSRSSSSNESSATTVHAQAPGGPSIGASSHDTPVAPSSSRHSHSHSHSGSGTPPLSSRRSSATPSPAPHAAAAAAAASSTALPAHSSRRSSAGGAIPPAAAASASDYTLGEVLGQGLFGKVYRATEKASGVSVAIKIFVFDAATTIAASAGATVNPSSPHSGSSSNSHRSSHSRSGSASDDHGGPVDAREAVRREVLGWSHMTAAHSTPNLLPLYAALPYGSTQLWVVSQLQELGSFADILARRKKLGLVATLPAAPKFMPTRLVGYVLRGALLGLQQLYACYPAAAAGSAAASSAPSAAVAASLPGHGSVKCSGLLLSGSGQVRLADRAAAQRLDATFKPQGMAGVVYMSPESIAEPSSAPRPRDVWQLGIAAIELAEGITPHAGVNPMKICSLIPRGPSPTLRVAEEGSALLVDFIARCCAKQPTTRWTVAQLLSHPLIESSANVAPAEIVEFAKAGMA